MSWGAWVGAWVAGLVGDLGQDLGDLRSGSGPDPRESGLIFWKF